ncbi:MAG: hypothetical protein AB1792_01575 [Candidatus Zixiibacteriota bacterium]
MFNRDGVRHGLRSGRRRVPEGRCRKGSADQGHTVCGAASGSPVTVNAGTNRTVPGTFCNGNWQGWFAYTVGDWYAGDEFYAAYQDPSNPSWWNGTCINSPSFDVTAISMIVRFADELNDSADIARLLSWVSGHPADRPLGAWRF